MPRVSKGIVNKIIYFANVRIPTEKAHGIQIMKTCEALAKQGVQVELVVPKRQNKIKEDAFNFYGVERNFKIEKLWSLDFVWLRMPRILKKLAFWKQSATFASSVLWFIRNQRNDILYTRDLLFALVLPKEKLFYEVHWLPEKLRWYHRCAYRRAKGLIVISNGIKNDLLKFGILSKKICVARDAVDLEQFQINVSKEDARKKFSLPAEQKIVIYTGHLYEWKGVDVLAETVKLLPRDIHVYLVGGTDEDVRRFQKKYQAPNLHVIGWQKHERIPYWLRAADILVLPNSAKFRIGAKDTSPLKLFEYMLAGRPIIASNVPAIREVLSEDTAEFIPPDDATQLALGIQAVFNKREIFEERVRYAKSTALKYTWDKRAMKIIGLISN